ncbi:hypothetical protein GGR52DRAFT_591133 [Hypoxylon sp. FL1284]|nr:hypothetical protein GGR52DRAFT_591133 [Hypoxylon sp. FL1284]
MHRRKSTSSKHLGRRKSTSSVRSVHLEHIHPMTAERDAQAAATQAFTRAQGRSATDTVLWPPPRNNDARKNSSIGDEPSLERQRSIRFIPTRPSRSTINRANTDNGALDRGMGLSRVGTNMNSSELRPPSNASAAGMVSATKGIAGDYINTILLNDEYYTPEDDIASTPSSYQKTRKSRSMIATSANNMSSRAYNQVPASSIGNRIPRTSTGSSMFEVDENEPPAGLKAPKSMSFLKSRRDHPSFFTQNRGGYSKERSSNESLRDQGNRVGLIRSESFAPQGPRPIVTNKFMRKSIRDSGNGIMPMGEKTSEDGNLKIRARKVSSNFKHKLKSFFSLAKGDSNNASLPPQQVQALKSHNTGLNDDEYMSEREFPFDSAYNGASLSRVPSGVPSLHPVPSHKQLRSRRGSFESSVSERRASNERSRVTSWSNSDTNTISTTNIHRGEWERHRLSIINEDGVHISSSSARMPANSTFHHLPPPVPPQPAPIDSQRIYSALMKKLDDTNQHSQRNEIQRQKSLDDFMNTGAVPPRGSSRPYVCSGAETPPTIRHVLPRSASDLPTAKSTERKPARAAARAEVDAEQSYFPPMSQYTQQSRVLPSDPGPASHEFERTEEGDDQVPPVPRIEAPTPPPRTLTTRSSAFFASPTRYLFRTESPYRRAIQESMKTESQQSQLKSPEFNPWMRSLTSLDIRPPSTSESEMDKKMLYAESTYSSMTEDRAVTYPNKTHDLVESLPKAQSAHGDATIFVDPQPVYRPTPPPVPKHREISSASSVEWKTWLSANVSKLEDPPTHANTGIVEYVVPSSQSSGHVREEAQINDDDDQPPIEVYRPTGSGRVLTPLEQATRNSSNVSLPASNGTTLGVHYRQGNEEAEFPPVQTGKVLCSTLSLAGVESAEEENVPPEPRKTGVFDSIRRRSSRKPSLHSLRGNPTSKKSAKNYPGIQSGVTTISSPVLAVGTDKQSGHLGGGVDSRGKLGGVVSEKVENVSPKAGVEVNTSPCDTQRTGALGPAIEFKPQTPGSKKMVDLFLSSRRRRISSGGDSPAFI